VLLALGRADERSAHAATPPTIVSLNFDDGWADVRAVGLPLLESHNMVATFYLNSPRIGGDSAYMTWKDVADLAKAGNEIAGHTAYHEDLPTVDPTEAQRQICYDRTNLINHGYNVTDFAYPYGDNNAAIQADVQQCGYNSARTVQGFTGGASAGQIPPPNPYAIQVGTADSTVSALEAAVTQGEQTGGWVPLVFHHICNSCDPDFITQGDFKTFLDWLQGQEQTNNVVVETMQQVIGGAFQPAVQGPPLPPPVNGASVLRNASFEIDSNGDAQPDCWTFDDFGNNSFVWTRTTDAHTGTYAERLDVTNYQDGDNKIEVLGDLGFCEPTVTPGRQYRISEWYKSNAPVFFTVFSRDSGWTSSFWTSSPTFPSASTWTQATWVTPPVPAGINGLTFGLALGSNGSLTVDDASMVDANPTSGADTTPPTVSLTSPTGGTVAGTVPIIAAASDDVAVDHVDFLVDGTVVGTTVTPPYQFTWNSHSASNGSHTISVRAVDTSGNSKTSSPVTVTVANSSVNLLQNPGLEQGSGNTPSCWQLAGYGTNTATWTWTTDSHSGNAAENLNISSYTNGDRKLLTAFNSCSVAVTAGHSYTVSAWYKSVTATAKPSIFSFTSSTGPNGPYSFLANSPQQPASTTWKQVTWSTPTMAAGVTNLSIGLGLTGQTGSVTMDDFSLIDNAPIPDTTPPSSELSCNGGGETGNCSSGYYDAPVQVTMSATDDPGGSGVAKIVYTTDGSTPTATNGITYTGSFSVAQTTTIKYRAIDNAGNLESVNTQLIRIDTTPPTASIQCNGGSCNQTFSSAVSVTLSEADTGGSGNAQIVYTTDGTDPSTSNGNYYLGAFSVSQATTVKFIAYDAAGNASQIYTQPIAIDTTAPVSAIACGGQTCLQTPYASPVSVSLSAVDSGSGVAAIYYTTDGSTPTPTNGTTYSSPFTLSTTATVQYRAIDNAGNLEPTNAQTITIDTTPPSVSLTAPANGSVLRGQTTLTATASDNLAVAQVEFLVDGVVVGADAAGPYTFTWNSASLADGQHTIAARATDSAGNQTTSASSTVTTDQTPPASSINCNSAPCQQSAYTSPVTVSLQAVDATSGVAEIVYTTDGTDPTISNGAVYTGPFAVSSTTTVKYRAFDVAGNAEAVNAQTITITTPVTVTLTEPNDGSTVAGSSVLLAAQVTGTTPDEVDFLVDGTVVGRATSAPYRFNWDSTTVPDGPHTITTQALSGGTTIPGGNSAGVTVSNGSPPLDTTPPTSTVSCNNTGCQSTPYSNPVSVSLQATDNLGGSGVAKIMYTLDGSTPTQTNGTQYDVPFTVQTTTTVRYRAFDNAGNAELINTQTITIDLQTPSIDLTAPATGDVVHGTVPLNATVTGITADHVDFLVDGTVVGSATTSPYSVSWNSSTVSDGSHTISARAVSGGTTTNSNSATVTVQNTSPPPPDTTPPTSSIVCNYSACGAGFYSSAVSVTLTAADDPGGSGVKEIVYTTDGSIPTLTHGNVYGGSFSIASTMTVRYRAFDNAGNAESVNSQLIQIDTIAPTTTIKCNGSTCSGGFYTAAVTVTLSATDAGGSGLNEIVYTTDGSDPTSANGAVYTGPFALASSATVRYRAIDNAGNIEPINSAQLQIDTTAPTTTISCAGSPCTTSHPYQPGVSVSLAASDDSGGSGVAQTRYTTDGSVPTKTTGTIYTAPFTLSQTTTVNFRSYDNAGNLEANETQQVQIDPTAPTVSLTTPAAGSLVSGQVAFSANASDNVAVARVDFLVDGSVVGSASASPYTYNWSSASVADGPHTIQARAVDTAGNTTTTSATPVTVANTNLLQNPGLEQGSGNTPTCWGLAGYGTNTPTWTWTSDAHAGSKAENLVVSNYTNGDRKMIQSFTATCATAVAGGQGYTVTVWYKSTAPSVIFAFASTGAATGPYSWWAQSPALPAAAGWTQATWSTPTVPASFTYISTGMGMQNAGSLTMDDFGLFRTR
jgi:hypothetical protein